MSETKDEAVRLKWLKATVIGLGVVFLGLATLLIVLIMTGGPKRTAGTGAVPSAPKAVAVEDMVFGLPKNSRVADVLATGNRIVLRVRLADGTERLYALDGETLKPLGSITVQVEK